MSITILFVYEGWMYESRGGKTVSLPTKLWVLGVKLLSSKSKPLLYSYQGSLPKLPLPPVNGTMKRVLIIIYLLNLLNIFLKSFYVFSI